MAQDNHEMASRTRRCNNAAERYGVSMPKNRIG